MNKQQQLYDEAMQLWLKLFNLENYVVGCQDAWRMRLLTERAFRRATRRREALTATKH